jgi:hypothetical protein
MGAALRRAEWLALSGVGTKAETDIAYETNLRHLLSNAEHIFTAAATHNVRSAAMVKGLAKHFGLEPGQYEFQMLSGMAGTQARSSAADGRNGPPLRAVRPLVPGMAYLVRRLVENTTAEGAIRTQYLEEGALDRILADPRTLIPAEYSGDDALDKKPQESRNTLAITLLRISVLRRYGLPSPLPWKRPRIYSTLRVPSSICQTRPSESPGAGYAGKRLLRRSREMAGIRHRKPGPGSGAGGRQHGIQDL